MANRPARSLKYEYELFVDEEIENYKESIPRGALLAIGDEAVASLGEQAQFALTELLLVQEVDRIIFRRLRLPSYQTWRRRRLKLLREMRRPEHWGLQADDLVVRAVRPTGEARVLVAGLAAEAPALYFAANGCEVTAVANEDVVERVLAAATAAGLGERIHAQPADWSAWAPDAVLDAVIVTSSALRGLTAAQRTRVIKLLQGATADGGIHLLEAADTQLRAPTLRELESRYEGWSLSLERDGSSEMLLARKEIT